jgi:hypothetical protein
VVRDGTAARKKRVRSLEKGLGQQLEPSVWSAKSSGGDQGFKVLEHLSA